MRRVVSILRIEGRESRIEGRKCNPRSSILDPRFSILYHFPMPLPILSTSSETLIRLFHKTENHWAQHLADEVQLACGSAYCNPTLNKVWDANRLLNGSLPDGATPAESFGEVQAYFAQQGSHCLRWQMNPSAPPERVDVFIAHLEKLGFAHRSHDIMYLSHMPTAPIPDVPNLQ